MSSDISSISLSLNYTILGILDAFVVISMRTRAIMLYVHLLFLELTIANSLLYGLTAKDMQKLYKKYRTKLPDWSSKQIAESVPPLYWESYIGFQYVSESSSNSCIQKQTWNNSTLHTKPLKPHNYSNGNMFLRSHAADILLVSKRTHTTYGDNAFCNVVPALWNKCNSLRTFIVLQLLNLIWKHFHFQNDTDSAPSKVVIKATVVVFNTHQVCHVWCNF